MILLTLDRVDFQYSIFNKPQIELLEKNMMVRNA